MPLRPHNGLVLRLGSSLQQQSRLKMGASSELVSRSFSSGDNKNKNGTSKFQPQRRPDRNYRPIVPRVIKKKGPRPEEEMENPMKQILDLDDFDDDSLSQYGASAMDALDHLAKLRNERQRVVADYDAQLRLADYFTADHGSTEDLVGERKALAADIKDPAERERFLQIVDKLIDQERFKELDLDDDDFEDEVEDDDDDDEEDSGKMTNKKLQQLAEAEDGDHDREIESEDPADVEEDPNLLAKGKWGAELITVDYVQKPQEGGRKGSYRALAIGGNGNGCGGFAIGKAENMDRAIEMAIRNTRRNPYFVERFNGCMLTGDLAGKHNSCLVKLRSNCNGLKGNELVSTILLHFGVTHCNSKSHGNRNDFNVVYATFKALMTHESLEEIALKRGRRLISIDRARRLQI